MAATDGASISAGGAGSGAIIAGVLVAMLLLLAIIALVYWRRHADDASLGGLAKSVRYKLGRE